jgi:hypothetical protein
VGIPASFTFAAPQCRYAARLQLVGAVSAALDAHRVYTPRRIEQPGRDYRKLTPFRHIVQSQKYLSLALVAQLDNREAGPSVLGAADVKKTLPRARSMGRKPKTTGPRARDPGAFKSVLVRVNPEGWRALKVLAVESDTTLNALAVEAFNDLLKKHGKRQSVANPLL